MLSACQTGLGKQVRGEGLVGRSAQLAMWKSKRWQAPYYWAGFLIQGEWRDRQGAAAGKGG